MSANLSKQDVSTLYALAFEHFGERNSLTVKLQNAMGADDPPFVRTTTRLAHAINSLIAVARAADYAAENAGDVRPDGALVDPGAFEGMTFALEALDNLPDDRPGYTMSGPARAEWALRDMIGEPKP